MVKPGTGTRARAGGGSVESRKVLIQLVESDIRDLAKVKVEGPEKPSDKV